MSWIIRVGDRLYHREEDYAYSNRQRGAHRFETREAATQALEVVAKKSGLPCRVVKLVPKVDTRIEMTVEDCITLFEECSKVLVAQVRGIRLVDR